MPAEAGSESAFGSGQTNRKTRLTLTAKACFTPERSSSAITEPLYRVRPTTTAMKGS